MYVRSHVYCQYVEDKLFADRDFNKFSVDKLEESMYKFSETPSNLYPGYKYDEKMRIRADTEKVIRFSKL